MAALNCLAALCELLPHEARVAHLLPLVRGHMQPLELEAPLQRTLAAAFPRLLAAVSRVYVWLAASAGMTLAVAETRQQQPLHTSSWVQPGTQLRV